ncbi:MAG: ABC transporter ATP-binding protein [Phycisphaerales bacterium]|nr:ABC transporter ATP-binding protein [Phycisphaerales bacterium]
MGAAPPPLIRVANLHKTYRMGRALVPVLRGVSLEVGEGEFVAVLGASGSGKSTLLHLMGGLDRPDVAPRAEIVYRGVEMTGASVAALDRYRTLDVGFIFQFYHLLPELNVIENVLVGAMIRLGRLGYMRRGGEERDRAAALLDTVGLSHRLKHRPAELSGGERQRVAIARALMNDPSLLLADEPTGNLDHATGERVLEALLALREQGRRTMVVVTHDPDIAARADRVLRLADGVFETS